jgi:glucose/arabinose dehydrogenase
MFTESILRHVRRRLTILACAIVITACDSKSPAPPVVTPPGGSETITGTERIGWDQRAGDAVELAGISYVVYVDSARTPLTEVTCATAATASGFPCTARLPAMAPGSHTLQLASTVNDGGLIESERSAALNVNVRPQTAGDLRPPEGDERTTAPITPGTLVTADGIRLRVELVAAGLQQPSDLAFTSDGRMLVAERAGTVRIVPRQPQRATHGIESVALSLAERDVDTTLLAVAVDPQFERSRHVYVLYRSTPSPAASTFTIARFRELGGTLADRVVVLDGVPAASGLPAATLRFGPDGRLYAAFDDGGDPGRRSDRGSLNGKVLRINPDGTTPRDQAGATPIYAEGYGQPVGIDWDPQQATLWVADRDGAGTLRAVVEDAGTRAGERRGALRGSYALPRGSVPASLAFYGASLIPGFNGSVLVASNEGQHLLRITGDRVEALLQNRAGGIRSVAIAPDGAIYFANANAVGRMVPDGP